MARLGGQSLAVNPYLRRRRSQEVADIYAMRGQATEDVKAKKEAQRLKREQDFREEQDKKELEIANQKLELDKQSHDIAIKGQKAAKRAGQIGTGIQLGTLGMNLLGTTGGTMGYNMSKAPLIGGAFKPGSTLGGGLGAAAMGAGAGQLVNSSKKWKKGLVGGTVGALLGGASGGWGSSILGGIGGALGGFIG
jgi:hypothetical protein